MRTTQRRRSNAEWSEETRGKLMAAARTAFTTDGFAGASIDNMAAVVDLTKGAIYHHYGDKRGLFRAVFEDIERQLAERINAVAERAASPLAALVQGSEAFLDAVLDERASRIILIDGPSVLGWHEWRAIDYEMGGRLLRAGLEEAMRQGEIVRLDLDCLTSLISGALNEVALTLVDAPKRPRARRAASRAIRRLFSGLRPTR